MDLIALAQSSGEVSLDAYTRAKQDGTLGTPRMQGLERFVNPPMEPDPHTNPYINEPEPAPAPQPTPPQRPVDSKPWSTKKAVKPLSTKDVTSIVDGLKKIYFNKVRTHGCNCYCVVVVNSSLISTSIPYLHTQLRPLEEMYKFGSFFSPLLNESDFEARPSVLLLGQYSTGRHPLGGTTHHTLVIVLHTLHPHTATHASIILHHLVPELVTKHIHIHSNTHARQHAHHHTSSSGKSTFIKHLLGRNYPGINIGPEPTTDRFVVVMHGLEERRTPGNTLVVQPDKPYQGLAVYGNGFLSKFECAQCDSPLLQEITLVDTPGVLSGEKQRIERTYDFIDVCSWFASRCDLILLLFDPHKLDISDEFKQVVDLLSCIDD